MATLKAIKTRIKSIESTQQITQAMKLVSAAKLRRTQDRIIHLREYSKILTDFLQLVFDEDNASISTFLMNVLKVKYYLWLFHLIEDCVALLMLMSLEKLIIM